LTQLFDEVDQDVRAAPLTSVHAAEKIDAGALRSAPVADLDRIARAPLPSHVRQFNQFREAIVWRRGGGRERRLDVRNVEVMIELRDGLEAWRANRFADLLLPLLARFTHVLVALDPISCALQHTNLIRIGECIGHILADSEFSGAMASDIELMFAHEIG